MYIYASTFLHISKKYVFLTETRIFYFHDPLFSFFTCPKNGCLYIRSSVPCCRSSHSWKEAGRTVNFSFHLNHS